MAANVSLLSDSNQTCVDILDFYRNMNDWTTYPLFHVATGLVYSLIILVAILGNSLVITAILRDSQIRSVRNLFIASLSCTDIMVCVTSGVFSPISAIIKTWAFGAALCNFLPLIQGMSICISTFTLTSIAIDRYILIIHPTTSPITRNIAVSIIFGVWCLAFAVAFPASLHHKLVDNKYFCGIYCGEAWGDSSKLRQAYGILLPIVQFCIPLTVITVCYARIHYRLKQGVIYKAAVEARRSSNFELVQSHQIALQRQKRTNRMLISMVVIFVICWLPWVLFNFLRDIEMHSDFVISQYTFFAIFAHSIAMTSTCWNPILYAWLNEQFREAFVNFLPERLRIKIQIGRSQPKVSRVQLSVRRSNNINAVNERTSLLESNVSRPILTESEVNRPLRCNRIAEENENAVTRAQNEKLSSEAVI